MTMPEETARRRTRVARNVYRYSVALDARPDGIPSALSVDTAEGLDDDAEPAASCERDGVGVTEVVDEEARLDVDILSSRSVGVCSSVVGATRAQSMRWGWQM